MKKKIISIVVAVMLVFGLSAAGFAAGTQTYADVPSTHWAYSSIESCTVKGLMQGVGDNKFDPEGTLTRAQVAQVCYNAYKDELKGTTDKTITDVLVGTWYRDAMYWMMANGIVGGTAKEDGVYCYPNATADRKYVALVLNRLANKLGVELPKTNAAVVFPDIGELGSEYQKAIGALQQAGVIAGFPDGTYKPGDSLTRAQAAKLFDLYTNIDGLKLKVTEVPPTVQPTPTSPNPVDWPRLSGSNVWWEDDIYQEILDYAATKDSVVTHTEVAPDKAVIYVGAKWPVMAYCRLIFSKAGFSYTFFTTDTDYVFRDRGTVEIVATSRDANVATTLDIVDQLDAQYYDKKDRGHWALTPPSIKFPWE